MSVQIESLVEKAKNGDGVTEQVVDNDSSLDLRLEYFKKELELLLKREAEMSTPLEGKLFDFLKLSQATYKSLHKEIDRLTNQKAELQEENKHKKDFITTVYNENVELSKKNAKLEKECKTAQEDCVSQIRVSNLAYEESKRFESRLLELRKQVCEHEKTIKELSEANDELITQHDKEKEEMLKVSQARERVYLVISIVSIIIFIAFY